MSSIQYDVMHTIANEDPVDFSMQVKINKCDSTSVNYSTMLLIKFNDSGKVILWYEVYVQTGK